MKTSGKIAAILGMTAVAIIVLMLLIAWNLNSKAKQRAKIRYLPRLALTLPDNTVVYTDHLSGKPMLLILFSTECEHCSYQAREISSNAEEFLDTNILFVTTESHVSIESFISANELVKSPNLVFAKITSSSALENFGTSVFPHLFIYNSEQILIHEFKGATKISTILRHINE